MYNVVDLPTCFLGSTFSIYFRLINLKWLCNISPVVTNFLPSQNSLSNHGDLDHAKAVGRIAFFSGSLCYRTDEEDSTASFTIVKTHFYGETCTSR